MTFSIIQSLYDPAQLVPEIYRALFAAYGPQNWWPGDSPEEIVIGAILTQNTNWQNVEKAIARLRENNLLDFAALRDVPVERLAELIRSAGYYNIKAKRLKNFIDWIWREYDGQIRRLATVPLNTIRSQLLEINGIGPETADAILLYAVEKTTFVIDAYTSRLAKRHGFAAESADYHQLKDIFEQHLPPAIAQFNEYHALIVHVGKRHCGPTPDCNGCPLAYLERVEVPQPSHLKARKVR